MKDIDDFRIKTVPVIFLARLSERADEVILPAMFKYIARDFKASPQQMGALSTCRGVTQALTSPIGGISGTFAPHCGPCYLL